MIDQRLIYESPQQPAPSRADGAELLLLIIVLATVAPFIVAWVTS